MKIVYSCDCCGEFIDTIEIEHLDESKLGFDCLTLDEREHLLRLDSLANIMYVQSLCDTCIEELGLNEQSRIVPQTGLLH